MISVPFGGPYSGWSLAIEVACCARGAAATAASATMQMNRTLRCLIPNVLPLGGRTLGMRQRSVRFICIVALAAVAAAPRAQQATSIASDQPEYGPPKGTLIIVGGGNLNGSGIHEKFIQLAGGPEKNFVIVPTAGGNRN